jgi:hypothetical protein
MDEITARAGVQDISLWEDLAVQKKSKQLETERRLAERRGQGERRKQNVAVAAERRSGERRKVPRRRQIDPTTCERDYTADEIEFMQAMDAYKRANGRMFPTCSEILEVIRDLGYVRAGRVDDSNVPSGVSTPDESAVSEGPAEQD